MLSKRIRDSYKINLNSQFIYMILESKSLSDLVGNIATIRYLIKSDYNLIASLKDLQNQLTEKVEFFKKEEKDLMNKKTGLQTKNKQLEVVRDKHDKIASEYKLKLDELKILEDKKKEQINLLSQEEKNIEDEIARYIARYKEDTADLQRYFNNSESANKPTFKGFIRPVSGKTITSVYVPRVHPTTGKNSFHTGVDFSEPKRTPIKAAKAGKITTATFHTAYGNMVIIDNLYGTSSLYAHSSELLVVVGQTVSEGEVIAKVGLTGYIQDPIYNFK